MARIAPLRRIHLGTLLLAGLLPLTSWAQEPSSTTETPPPGKAVPAVDPGDDVLNMDIGQLGQVQIQVVASANPSAPSSQISQDAIDLSTASTVGELARQAPNVSTRRTSGINIDPRVRGYHSGQLNATANGMSELKTRLDIDSVFSQIDPGVVDNLTVIDGPYTSLYGPGFAFLIADLLQTPRYANGPEFHSQTQFTYGSNGQSLYPRETVIGGDKDWGVCFSYGLRTSNDYLSGGRHPELVPSSYQKWDDLLTVSWDFSPIARLELDYIHCEMNNVELPGVIYDLENSTNNQFNFRYIIQEDRKGPKQLVLQSWYQTTEYYGDASHESKQQSFYQPFITIPMLTNGEMDINTVGFGFSNTVGSRLLRTFGEADSVQWTVGADWRSTEQRYQEEGLTPSGEYVLGGNVFGLARSRTNDAGVLTDLYLPWSERFSMNVGGRVDYCYTELDANDPVITEITDPSQYYYTAGFDEPNKVLGMAYVTSKTKLDNEWTLSAGTAFAMRMPDLAELYGDDPYVPLVRFGNSYCSGFSQLVPEKNLQLDLGLTKTEKKYSYGVRGFYAMIWDYIEPSPAFIDAATPAQDATYVMGRNFQDFPAAWRWDLVEGSANADASQAGYQYLNQEFVTFLGGDLFGEVQLSEWWSLYGSMAYVRGTNWDPVAFLAADSAVAADGTRIPLGRSEGVPGIYPLNGTIALRVTEPTSQRWMVEFAPRMVASQRYLATSLAELPTPGFTTFSIRGYYRLRERLRLNLALENLFNREYTEHGSLVIVNSQGVPTFVKEPGFTALVGIEAKF